MYQTIQAASDSDLAKAVHLITDAVRTVTIVDHDTQEIMDTPLRQGYKPDDIAWLNATFHPSILDKHIIWEAARRFSNSKAFSKSQT